LIIKKPKNGEIIKQNQFKKWLQTKTIAIKIMETKFERWKNKRGMKLKRYTNFINYSRLKNYNKKNKDQIWWIKKSKWWSGIFKGRHENLSVEREKKGENGRRSQTTMNLVTHVSLSRGCRNDSDIASEGGVWWATDPPCNNLVG
jgi:hypothetical protein